MTRLPAANCWIPTIAWILLGPAAWANSPSVAEPPPSSGEIHVWVIDKASAPLYGAVVVLRTRSGDRHEWALRIEERGVARFRSLPTGPGMTFDISVFVPGFTKVEDLSIEIPSPDTTIGRVYTLSSPGDWPVLWRDLPPDELDAVEAILRQLAAPCSPKEHTCPKAYSVTMLGRDPDSKFLHRFGTQVPPVRAGSRHVGDRMDSIRVTAVVRTGVDTLRIEASYTCGMLCGSGHVYEMVRELRGWRISSDRVVWVS